MLGLPLRLLKFWGAGLGRLLLLLLLLLLLPEDLRLCEGGLLLEDLRFCQGRREQGGLEFAERRAPVWAFVRLSHWVDGREARGQVCRVLRDNSVADLVVTDDLFLGM